MNYKFIQKLQIDWTRIGEYSYIRDIPALQFEDALVFEKNITFFVGENGTGKSTLLEAIAVAYGFNPEGGSKNYNFSTYDSHSNLYEAIRLGKAYTNQSGVISFEQKVFIMLPPKKRNMQIGHILQKDIIKNLMERVF